MNDRPCQTCQWHEDGLCILHRRPAANARMFGGVCGPDGYDHNGQVDRDAGPFAFVESWGFLAFLAFIVAAVIFFGRVLPGV
ncbi:MAG: hypothetical protein KA775_12355 [Ottowia sp.]|nr:hypothetical protein [Ottowia sp.]